MEKRFLLKNGKEEITYLLSRVISKYELDNRVKLNLNTNRKNYEVLAHTLSDISSRLPFTNVELGHELYADDQNPNLEYPYRKYDITSSQIKDAYNGVVANPRPFIVDACYIYLYNVGRKGFEQNPVDKILLSDEEDSENWADLNPDGQDIDSLEFKPNDEKVLPPVNQITVPEKKKIRFLVAVIALIGICLIVLGVTTYNAQQKLTIIKQDFAFMHYRPTTAEIDSLEGIWLYYTGAPQSRLSDSGRFHMVVNNILNIEYKDGYFTFDRYGANINHKGYMLFESPGIISIHSNVVDNISGQRTFPTVSLLRLNKNSKINIAVSSTWSFDTQDKNDLIAIRNVYIKLGKEGSIYEIENTPENISCHCKIIKWSQLNKKDDYIYLKYSLLDTLKVNDVKNLIDEKSFILRQP